MPRNRAKSRQGSSASLGTPAAAFGRFSTATGAVFATPEPADFARARRCPIRGFASVSARLALAWSGRRPLMKLVMLARNPGLYSHRRIVEAARRRGHEIDVINTLH